MAVFIFSSGLFSTLRAQLPLPHWPDSLFSPYYHQRVSQFELLPASRGAIIFLGNSITDGAEWTELFGDARIRNRGISGDLSAGVLNRLGTVLDRNPAKVFLMIGINDLARGITEDSILNNISRIAALVHAYRPATRLYIQSLLPVNAAFGKFSNHTNKTAAIRRINKVLSARAREGHYVFIDLYTHFCDQAGRLQPAYTNDGLHLKGRGYMVWKQLIFPHVFDLQEKPALIPAPRELDWNKGFFPLYQCRDLVVTDTALKSEALQLQQDLAQRGIRVAVRDKKRAGQPFIELRLDPTLKGEEAYQLLVDTAYIMLRAATAHGVFNGIQTLRQLCRNGTTVDACRINDAPAFSWRGYMVDVGRNYMSMELLKQQIDVMSRYKFNVFHFHATEDIAWRFASDKYPQLNRPEHMLRNKGMYYTKADLQELISYCRQKHITLVPEIDMPGHSAAFRRAMHTDMQSDTGMHYVKELILEFCENYDLPYIHMGADEVHISNPDFVPQMTRLLESKGRKVIGWQPGGNFPSTVMRQLWMQDETHLRSGDSIQCIDSRHLYLNHMDPLEAVVTIFNRRIGDVDRETSSMKGATLCIWHDRAVRSELDILRMNPVYPGMLAFAERTWEGGGAPHWISNISEGDVTGFRDFENRLLEHKTLYFQHQPFPYQRQSMLQWELIGPYDNDGLLSRSFTPETLSEAVPAASARAMGGTVVLRHWWAPLIQGALKEPRENSTWYARTRIWSDTAGTGKFWVGFNNLSRSTATDSPPAGAWDEKGSAVWVNGQLVPPPQWAHPGWKGHAEIPLADEDYAYRPATRIPLKKGWNQILLKMPVGSFRGRDWQHPVKWMFTFVPAADDEIH
ncbi:hypothetical protein GCM10027051_34470 [Niabella terrae]